MCTLFKRRTVPVPTRFGFLFSLALLALPLIYWVRYGEAFLSPTERLPARILVVEGWIGPDAIRAAKVEFDKGGYDFILTSGGSPDPDSEENWQEEGWTYAEGALHILVRSGVPAEKIISAPPPLETETARTYKSALSVKAALVKSGLTPASINIFSFGSHARRSRLVYEKVLSPETRVGIIAYTPPGYTDLPWWRSSERAEEFLIQSVGFFYEFLFNSGRRV
jgi:hypothetical protein